ncbi:MAG: GHMP kinase [Chloroflexota bacterium]|nr:GHMP kinase [Chloroflexota bacterium]
MIVVRAPVRISFGGGGTDLEAYYALHGGFVVSTTITRYCYVIVREPSDQSIRINSADYRVWQRFDPREIPPVEEPLVLAKAAIERFAEYGIRERGVDLFLTAEVAPGTGLGSSSAMAVALSQALATYAGPSLTRKEAADLASWLEIERLGMPIGKQDQYASAYGGLNTIEFMREGVRVRPLPLSSEVRDALCSRLLLFSTGQCRNSAEILAQQREDTRTKPTVNESLHRLKELAQEMACMLRNGELDAFGRLLDSGWQEKRRLSNKVSNPTIDRWYSAARDAGALGGKISGAGGGGFLLLYCPPNKQGAVRETMARMGLRELTFDFDVGGVQAIHFPESPDVVIGSGGYPSYASNGKRQERYSYAG